MTTARTGGEQGLAVTVMFLPHHLEASYDCIDGQLFAIHIVCCYPIAVPHSGLPAAYQANKEQTMI